MNMEASRWWLHLAKAGDLEVVVACADIAERERDRIGSSMGGRVSGRRGRRAIRRRPVVHRRVSRRGRGGGGIHRCGSLRADDCGLIDRRRAVFSWDVLRLKAYFQLGDLRRPCVIGTRGASQARRSGPVGTCRPYRSTGWPWAHSDRTRCAIRSRCCCRRPAALGGRVAGCRKTLPHVLERRASGVPSRNYLRRGG